MVDPGPQPPAPVSEKDNYNAKPPIFDGEKFDYWKDRLESFFLGHDVDLWDMVVVGYVPPTDDTGKEIAKRAMTDQQNIVRIIIKKEPSC